MNRISRTLRVGLIAFGFLFAFHAVAQQRSVTCNAQGAAAHACPADTYFGVLLVREVTPGKCVYGKTWHFDLEAIYVSNDCSAEFLVHPRRTDPRSKDGYQIQGTGADAFHTNGPVRPGPGAVDTDANEKAKSPANNPK